MDGVCCWGVYLEEIKWFLHASGVSAAGVESIDAKTDDFLYGFFWLVDVVTRFREVVLHRCNVDCSRKRGSEGGPHSALDVGPHNNDALVVRIPKLRDAAKTGELGALFPRYALQKIRERDESGSSNFPATAVVDSVAGFAVLRIIADEGEAKDFSVAVEFVPVEDSSRYDTLLHDKRVKTIDSLGRHLYGARQITGRVYPPPSSRANGPNLFAQSTAPGGEPMTIAEVVYVTQEDYPLVETAVFSDWNGKTLSHRLLSEEDRRLHNAKGCPVMVFVKNTEDFLPIAALLGRLVFVDIEDPEKHQAVFGSRGKAQLPRPPLPRKLRSSCSGGRRKLYETPPLGRGIDVFPCPWARPPTDRRSSMVSHGTTGGFVEKANVQQMLKAREIQIASGAVRLPVEWIFWEDRHEEDPWSSGGETDAEEELLLSRKAHHSSSSHEFGGNRNAGRSADHHVNVESSSSSSSMPLRPAENDLLLHIDIDPWATLCPPTTLTPNKKPARAGAGAASSSSPTISSVSTSTRSLITPSPSVASSSAASSPPSSLSLQQQIDSMAPVGRQCLLRDYWADLDDFENDAEAEESLLRPSSFTEPPGTQTVGPGFLSEGGKGIDTTLPLCDLRFSQRSISDHFRNGKFVHDVVAEMRSAPELLANFPALNVVRVMGPRLHSVGGDDVGPRWMEDEVVGHVLGCEQEMQQHQGPLRDESSSEGAFYSMDNRRLWLYRQLYGETSSQEIPVRLFLSHEEYDEFVGWRTKRVFESKMTTDVKGASVLVTRHFRFRQGQRKFVNSTPSGR